MGNLMLYSIMPLDVEHIDEICEDIRVQVETGVATCPLFKATLVPEGNPVINKAEFFCKQYSLFKEKLDKMGIKSGILVQATIGHGWKLSERNPYQNVVYLHNGDDDVNTVCPYDEGFRKYIYDAMRTIASYNPDAIMVDDDFRLLAKPSFGCACRLHMKRFNEISGENLTRHELFERLENKGEDYRRLLDCYVEAQKESLVDAAKTMRKGVDSVNPKLAVSFCCVGCNAEFAADISRALAGKGNPAVVRINGANYSKGGNKEFTVPYYRVASQIAKLKGKADIFLAETDTCPQNRYSTSAMTLHSHFAASIIEGTTGAKHWITRLLCYEPESGKAYRKILAKWSGFYEELARIIPKLSWIGMRIPVFSDEKFYYDSYFGGSREDYINGSGWQRCVLDKFGLPMFFSSETEGVACLEEDAVKFYSDADIKQVLSKNVFLTSGAAKVLQERGFGEHIGVTVREYTGEKIPSGEMFAADGKLAPLQPEYMELLPSDDSTVEDSIVYHGVRTNEFERMFAGTAVYKNSLGGTVCTFCGTPKTEHRIATAYSFLSYSRKQQFIRLLKQMGELYIYYPGDEEMYFRAAKINDGSAFCALFNLGFDPIEKIKLVIYDDVNEILKLMPDGTYQSVSFEKDEETYVVDSECITLEPVILIIK